MISSGYNDPSIYKCWKLFRATLIWFCLFVPRVTEGENDKASAARPGSAVKFEEGLGTTEEDPSAAAEETGEQPDGLYQTEVAFNVLKCSISLN